MLSEKALEQVNRFSGSHWKGFTEASGGRREALRRYDLFVEKEGPKVAQLNTPPSSQSLKKKERSPSWQAEKDRCGKIRRTGGGGSAATCQSRPIETYLDSSRYTSSGEGASSASGAVSGPSKNSSTEDGRKAGKKAGSKDTANSKFLGPNRLDSRAQDKVDNPCRYPLPPSAPTDTASNASSDYGEFPDDLAQLTSTQTPSIKREPGLCNSSSCELIKLLDSKGFQLSNTQPELCDEQKNLTHLILHGENVFYTGSAGSGKSTVLRTFVSGLRVLNKRVRILASTGKAALQAGGVTIHSYAGWTPQSMAKSIERLKQDSHKKQIWKRFNETDVLVIDEISMAENHFFERLNRVMKDSRGNEKPFGGVQVIVTGDFYQLAPVKPLQYCMECGTNLVKLNEMHLCNEPKCKDHGLNIRAAEQWAFCSEAWAECKFHCVKLEEIHRQNDRRFIAILQKFRCGQDPSKEDIKYILSKGANDRLASNNVNTEETVRRENHKAEKSFEQPFTIKLFPRLDDVALENEKQLALLDHECLEFLCFDHFKWNRDHKGLDSKNERGIYDHTLRALDEHQMEALLELKKDMPVVLLVNLDFSAGLINGSQGFITGFREHNSGIIPDSSGAHAKHKHHLIEKFIAKAGYPRWPIVRFPDAGGREVTIYPQCMITELGDGGDRDNEYSLLSRTQIPLTAGWAITIHKSQGMTLSQVEVNLARSFERSQRYVALSRARDVQGLTVTDFGGRIQGADPEVSAFMDGTEWLDLSGRFEKGEIENG